MEYLWLILLVIILVSIWLTRPQGATRIRGPGKLRAFADPDRPEDNIVFEWNPVKCDSYDVMIQTPDRLQWVTIAGNIKGTRYSIARKDVDPGNGLFPSFRVVAVDSQHRKMGASKVLTPTAYPFFTLEA